METRIEFLRPREIEAAMARCPVLFQPLGTIEWHGRHNVAGLDAVKAHALCVRAAQQGGGLVAPAVYGGIGGLAEPHTFVLEPEECILSSVLRPWLEALCREAVRQGFKAVILLTGHYGAGQQIVVRDVAVRATQVFGQPVLGLPEYFLALPEGYIGDHAATFETSLMLDLYPETVRLDELGEEPHQGVHGLDPKRHASAQEGQRLADAIVGRLARLAQRMPEWDQDAVARFAAAEQALVTRQVALAAETGNLWTAWRHIKDGAIAAYSDLLVDEQFEDIARLAKDL